MPRLKTEETVPSGEVPSSVKVASTGLPITKILEFSLEIGSCHSLLQLRIVFRADWKCACDTGLVTVVFNVTSSANNLETIFESRVSVRSFMTKWNKMAATTLPCGTPLPTGRLLETAEPTLTRWNLLDRNDAKHRYKFPWMPYVRIICAIIYCAKLSQMLSESQCWQLIWTCDSTEIQTNLYMTATDL